MKKLAVIIAALVVAAMAYIAGHREGIRHAIEDSAIWTVDVYNPENPEESAWCEYDQRIFIELDGNIYEHGMIQC